MAEAVSEIPQPVEGDTVEMELETESPPNPNLSDPRGDKTEPNGVEKHEINGGGGAKRGRADGDEADEEEEEEGGVKKPKVDRSVEEERLGKMEKEEGDKEEEVKESTKASLGPKVFSSSVEMFDYFFKLLHAWAPNLDVNKYEHLVLLDLLKKGHAEPAKKIGAGIEAFQVRFHPMWKSCCFFVIRVDGTVDDFSFRKCVDNIIPLPENMKVQSASGGSKSFDGKKAGGYHKGNGGTNGGGHRGRGGGRGGGRGRGRRGGFGK